MSTIIYNKNAPRIKNPDEVLREIQRRPQGDIFAGRQRFDLCVWKISAGPHIQTPESSGIIEDERYLSTAQWDKFFLGRDSVNAKYYKTLKAVIHHSEAQQEFFKAGKHIRQTITQRFTLFIKPDDWEDWFHFALFSVPAMTGDLFYVPTEITYKRTEENEFWYVEFDIKTLDEVLDYLNNNIRKNYVHYGRPGESYTKPVWNKTKQEIELITINPAKPYSCQITFFSPIAIGGLAFSCKDENDNFEIIGPKSFLDILPSGLDESVNYEETFVVAKTGGIEYQGQWADWKNKVKDLYDLSVRPKYEGVWKFVKAIEISAPSTTNTVNVKIKNTTKNTFVLSYYFVSSTTSGYQGSVSQGYYLPNYTNEESKATVYTNQRADFLIQSFARGTTDRFTKVNIPSNSDVQKPINKNYNFGTIYNHLKRVDLTNSSVGNFLKESATVNVDTPILPMEITEYLPIDFSSFGIGRALSFLGPIGAFAGLIFGVPLGFRATISRTETNFYDRKFDLLMGRTLYKMLSEGIYGKNDFRISLEHFTNVIKAPLIRGDVMGLKLHFLLEDISDKFLLTQILINVIGYSEIKLEFFDTAGQLIWLNYFKTQSERTRNIRDWATLINL